MSETAVFTSGGGGTILVEINKQIKSNLPTGQGTRVQVRVQSIIFE
jgi:hypothetical protein